MARVNALNALKKKCTKLKRKSIINRASSGEVNKIVEICQNLLTGKVPITLSQKKKLNRFRKGIYSVARAGRNIGKAKKAIIQSGGFLSILLDILGPFLPDLIRTIGRGMKALSNVG